MSMIWRKFGLINPALVGLTLLLPTTAIAVESLEASSETLPEVSTVETLETELSEVSQPLLLADAETPTTSVSDLMQETQADSMEQVTSVSQLSDVQPDDWAFQAIQSLVERYGCVAGYPDGTFRPSRAMSRREAAALVNACLDNLSNRFATKEDLDALKALQDEFAAELATLRGRVDGLEARVATVEAQQFSTTTKLKGEVVLGSGFVFDEQNPIDSQIGVGTDARNVGEDRFFFGQRTRLNFDTSFDGSDRLRIRLEAANIPELDENGAAGTSMARFGFDENDPPGTTVILDELNYRFKPAEDLTLKIAVVGGDYKDDVNTFNPFLKSSGSGALSRFFRVNPVVYRAPGGTTFSAVYDITDKVEFSVMYAADDADEAVDDGNSGLFSGRYGIMAQLGFNPTDDIGIGIQYARSRYTGGDIDITQDTGDAITSIGTDTSDPFGGLDTTTDNFGISAQAKITDGFHVSGWGGLTLARANAVANSEVKLLNWAANLIFPDLLLEGSRGSLSIGQQPFIVDAGTFGIDDGDDPNFTAEAQYQFKVNDNIKISPGLIVIINPNNTSSNDPIFIPVIRTTFKF
ncbi:iron uptake porin [Acaryochloris sp. IP29b_bin.137]|uniref:iron uptake porin n=1 Tax=Acaryochloris sp. IP29b_bin.137 TaxID=2969217 RepID=UPI00261F77C1|nr:iron uptake porin [Acaryochloris sp. IP29b_bin.137]